MNRELNQLHKASCVNPVVPRAQFCPIMEVIDYGWQCSNYGHVFTVGVLVLIFSYICEKIIIFKSKYNTEICKYILSIIFIKKRD
jgi:hypothetical protein